MASPPFNIAETVPEDDDVVSLFPGIERTFRDVVESWFLTLSNTYGYHYFPIKTTSQRDAITDWPAGTLIYNSTLKQAQMTSSVDPDVWVNLTDFPTGYRTVAQQTSAPTGWTKESNAAYNDALPVGTTGSVATSGATAVSSVLTSRTIAQANLPAVVLAGSGTTASNGNHAHTVAEVQNVSPVQGGGGTTYAVVVGTTSTGAAGTHDHSFSVTNISLGGSGTALDFNAKKFGVCVFQKD